MSPRGHNSRGFNAPRSEFEGPDTDQKTPGSRCLSLPSTGGLPQLQDPELKRCRARGNASGTASSSRGRITGRDETACGIEPVISASGCLTESASIIPTRACISGRDFPPPLRRMTKLTRRTEFHRTLVCRGPVTTCASFKCKDRQVPLSPGHPCQL
jgi:hypothetical protein